MKKLLSLLAFCSISFYAQVSYGQTIPNGDFESWSGDSLAQWYMSSHASMKSTDSHGGTYALHLQPYKDSTGRGEASYAQTVFSVSTRPASLTGYYKATLKVLDTAFQDSFAVGVVLYKVTNGTRVVVGHGYQDTLPPVSSYTSFSVPIQYVSGDTPDSAAIAIIAYFNDHIPNGDPFDRDAYIDDISFSGTAGFSSGLPGSKLSVYPNPASENLIIEASGLPQGKAELIIENILGSVVYRSCTYSNGLVYERADISRLDPGIYMIVVKINESQVVKRIMIRR